MTVDVAVWLGLKGGKDAEREFQQFGRSGKAAIGEIKDAARGLPPHLVAVSRGVSGIKQSVEDLAARTGTVGKMASSFGVAGLAAAGVAAGIGLAAAAMVRGARAAMEFGDELDDSAEKARVTTDYLQEMRYAVQQTGGSFADADAALSSFQEKLGRAQAGEKRSLRWAERLGFSQQDLKDFKSTQDALDAIMARISGLRKESEAAAAASAFGLSSILPLIRKGADEYERLRKEAHEFGFVMDADVVKRLADANDKFDRAAHVINVQFRSAFVNLAPVLIQVMQHLANMTKQVNELVGSMQRLDKRSRSTLEGQAAEASQDIEDAQKLPPGLRDAVTRYQVRKLARLNKALNALGPEASAAPGLAPTGELSDLPEEGAGKKAAAELDRYMKALAQARQNLAEEFLAGAKMSGTLEARYALQVSLLDLEKKTRESELDRQVKDGEMTAAHAASLKLAEEEVRQGKLSNLRAEEHQALEDQRLEQEKALVDLNDQLLQLAIEGARTAEERRRLELKALDARRAAERHELEVKDGRDANLTDAQRAQRLAAFDAVTEGQRGSVRQSTMGPLEAWRDGFLNTAGEVGEAIQTLLVDGAEQFSDGLLDAIQNAKDLGDVLNDVVDQAVAGLMRIAIQQAILKPFADWLGGGSTGGSGGGLWDTIANAAGSILGGKFGGGGDWAAYGNWGQSPSMTNRVGVPWYMMNASGRAGGGPVYRGDRRPVGEYGIETLAANSDGYVFDHTATARQMAQARAVGGAGGAGGGPIQVNLRNASGTPLQATARERRDASGGRTLDIDLVDLIDNRADARVRDLTEGRRDDVALSRNFGVRRNLSGS